MADARQYCTMECMSGCPARETHLLELVFASTLVRVMYQTLLAVGLLDFLYARNMFQRYGASEQL